MAKVDKAKTQVAAQAPPPATGKKINVHYLTRVEGHGNIVAEIDANGKVSVCRWEIPEAPRFFEAMLIGRYYQDVHHITSRICGICSIGHQLSSLQATEDAFGVQISEQTLLLRKLAIHAENMQSHFLHVGYLALPDFMGAGSVFPLAASHKEEVLAVVACHRTANRMSDMICGRTIHPQRMVPGGFAKLPTDDELRNLKAMLEGIVPKAKAILDVLVAVADGIPKFHRTTEYVALVSDAEYPLYWGEIGSSKTQRRPNQLYKDVTREYCLPQSTAKWTRGVDDSYMVGALSRFNLNHDKLSHLAKEAARKLGLRAPSHNPFHITLAQLVECFHSVEDSLHIIDTLLTRGLRNETPVPIKTFACKGVGAVEVPRGILFHAYEYDENGRIAQADCVIPTNQNHANIQRDLDALLPTLTGLSEADIELKLSMLVRAYDPCISCSTHHIDLTGEGNKLVKFIRK
jgi:coenzyme F420-reducing hydrogenase alpha subunit